MKVFTLLGLALPIVAAKVSYNGYKAFHIDAPEDFDHVEAQLQDIDYVSMACESNHKGFDIAVSPDSLAAFEKLGLKVDVLNEDLGADMALEGSLTPYVSARKGADVGFAAAAALPDVSYFNSYHQFQDHLDFLDDLQAAFPSNSDIFTAGKSLEGRPIQGIHLYGTSGPGTKPAIIWHGTVHAREWIVAPTVEYMAYKLVEGYQNGDAKVRAALNNYDFYIMPVVNPDGFVYTQSRDRLWRKNRQRRSSSRCIGTDVNRNWPYQWNVPGGSSTNPCAETYRGASAGDTPENQVLTNHTLSVGEAQGIKFYVDWHAFSQMILLPYGYSCSAQPDNLSKQMALARGVSQAIRAVNGLNFVYGPTCQTIYQTAGGSNDWVADIAGAELAWAFELRPGPGGSGGFVIPPSNIIPSGRENWAGMLRLFETF